MVCVVVTRLDEKLNVDTPKYDSSFFPDQGLILNQVKLSEETIDIVKACTKFDL